jgi:hypothetical protein
VRLLDHRGETPTPWWSCSVATTCPRCVPYSPCSSTQSTMLAHPSWCTPPRPRCVHYSLRSSTQSTLLVHPSWCTPPRPRCVPYSLRSSTQSTLLVSGTVIRGTPNTPKHDWQSPSAQAAETDGHNSGQGFVCSRDAISPRPMSHSALRNKAGCISYMRQEDNIYNNRVYRDKCRKTSEYLLHSGRLITK